MQDVQALIATLRAKGIRSQPVLDAISKVPRTDFLPQDWQDYAYDDTALPLAEGQTISQPYIVARMTEALLQGQRLHNVLEVGTGWGYQAAVLSCCIDRLTTLERIPSLFDEARRHLKPYANVTVYCRDGYEGFPQNAPYDGIIVTASPNAIPPLLLDQLAIQGRLVIPVGDRHSQQLFCVTKTEAGIEETLLDPVLFVPMLPGVAEKGE